MCNFNKILFLIILSVCFGFSFTPVSPLTKNVQAYGGGGGGGGEKNQSDDALATSGQTAGLPSGSFVTVNEACEAFNRTPSAIKEMVMDESLQSAIDFMDENSSTPPEPEKEEKELADPMGQALGQIVLELMIMDPELNPKAALGIAIHILLVKLINAQGGNHPGMVL